MMNLLSYSEHKCCPDFKESEALICKVCSEGYCQKCADAHKNEAWAKDHTFARAEALRKEVTEKFINSVERCRRMEKNIADPIRPANNFPFLELSRKANATFSSANKVASDYKLAILITEEEKTVRQEGSVIKMKKLQTILDNYANYFDLIGLVSELSKNYLELNDMIVEKQNEVAVAKLLLHKAAQKVEEQKRLLSETRKVVQECISNSERKIESVRSALEKLKDSYSRLIKASRKEIKKLAEEANRMKDEVRKVEKELAKKKAEAKKDTDNLNARIKKTEDEIKTLEEDKGLLNNEILVINYEISEKEKMQKKIKESLEAAQKKSYDLYIENKKAEITSNSLNEELIKLEEEIKLKTKEYEKISKKVDKIREEERKLEPIDEKIENMKIFTKKCLLMRNKVEAMKNGISILEGKKASAEAEMKRINEEWTEFCTRCKKKQSEIIEEAKKAREELNKLKSVKESEEREKKKLELDISERRKELADVRGKLARAREKVKSQEDIITKDNGKIIVLRDDIDSLTGKKTVLERSIDNLSKQRDEIKDRIDRYQKELAEAQEERLNSKKVSELQVLQTEIKKYRNELESLKAKEVASNTFMWICDEKRKNSLGYEADVFAYKGYKLEDSNFWVSLLTYLNWKKLTSLYLWSFKFRENSDLPNFITGNKFLRALSLQGSNVSSTFINSLLKAIEGTNLECLILDDVKFDGTPNVVTIANYLLRTKLVHFSAKNMPLDDFFNYYYNLDGKSWSLKWLSIHYSSNCSRGGLNQSCVSDIAKAYGLSFLCVTCYKSYYNCQTFKEGEADHKCQK
eukprot:TRINITY_DN9741_c0_g1_i6.p1 TRINITY_DN9741_c0_g1~~TRINITY_DN9741_c0_g1_i6.p1  ORF type:complete len:807 (+),score=199.08 TRINITY_DN9741_c0_g1_i6:240-2660(+)